jgi:rRNA maturation RNase YbeY
MKKQIRIKVLVKKDPRWSLSVKEVRELAKKVLVEFLDEGNVELSVLFVGKRKAKKLNQDYRKMNYVPQVLSFGQDEKAMADGWRRLGDIMICLPLLREEAIVENRLLMEVLEDWLRHGIKNLLSGK